MPRKSGPDKNKVEIIETALGSALGPVHIRELARRLEKVMSYQTVYRYLYEFMEDQVSIEGKYGPHNNYLVFVSLRDK